MNSNGTNHHSITGDLRYLQNTTWSPDNLHIGFDYDDDEDEWNELAEIHFDGSNKQVLYTPGGDYVDAWMGGYSSDPDRIIFSIVYYEFYEGNYYLDEYYSLSLNRIPYQEIIRFSPSNDDLFPDWMSLDRMAPSSQVNPLPEYSRSGSINLTWSGTDAGVAGIHGYFLEVKSSPASPWYNWFNDMEDPTHTHGTSTNVTGIAGNQMYFQVSGIDNAGNREAYPGGDGDASTKVFSYYLQGIINDNGELPCLPPS